MQPQPAPVPGKKKFGLGPLAQHYGVADMMDFPANGSNACPVEQAVDEEFLAYTTAAFQQKETEDTDILAF
jgi:hypothetical protein